MRPAKLHSYLLWRSSVDPDVPALAKSRLTCAVALLPAVMTGIFVFGWYAALVLGSALLGSFATDRITHRFNGNWILNNPHGSRDGIWLLTGLLVGLLMPPAVPLWVPFTGAVLAVLLGKHWLSVDGMPLLQPAAVGLLLLHIVFAMYLHPKTEAGDACWPVLARPLAAKQEATGAAGIVKEFFGGDIRKSVSRTEYEDVLFGKKDAPARTAGGQVAEAIYGPRPLDAVKAGDAEGVRQYQGIDVLLGSTPGPIGGASGVALVFGLLLIVFSGAVTWITPLVALGCMLALLTLSGDPHIGVHMLSPYTLIGFFYLAANPTTVPRSKRGKVLAGIAVAVLEVMLRKWTPLSEGTFLSAILVQSASFVFDMYIAQPKEKPRADDAAVEFSNLSRL